MSVQDILVGNDTVIVKCTDRENLEIPKVDDDTLQISPENLPNSIHSALTDKGFTFESQFPVEVELYVHDEGGREDKRKIAEQLQLDEDESIVQTIANLGYEIQIVVEVEDKNSWQVTKVFGKELKEPYSF